MVKIHTLSFLVVCLLVHSSKAEAQDSSELDEIFNRNFVVLDSVSYQLKNQTRLTKEETAFLYLINEWSGTPADFDHYRGLKFNAQHVTHYRKWYTTHKKVIDSNEFREALEIQTRFFTQGTVPDKELEYLEQLSKKYRKL